MSHDKEWELLSHLRLIKIKGWSFNTVFENTLALFLILKGHLPCCCCNIMPNYSQQREAPADWERVPGEASRLPGQRPADGKGEPEGRHHGSRRG